MTYQTPELLLVGAAQNLVLAGVESKLGGLYNRDAPGTFEPYSPFVKEEISW